MIQSLRQKHRLIVFVLALVLPLLFALALLVRKPIPANRQIPLLPPAKGITR